MAGILKNQLEMLIMGSYFYFTTSGFRGGSLQFGFRGGSVCFLCY